MMNQTKFTSIASLAPLIISLLLMSIDVRADNTLIPREQLHFKRITTKDGLPSTYINTILQRKNGLMWIGTKGGLARFDGLNITSYHYNPDNNNGLGSDDITALYEDHKQQLWVGTINGLYKFDDGTSDFNHIPTLDTNQPLVIFYITQDNNNRYWIGTDQGLYVLDERQQLVWQYKVENSIKFIGQSSSNEMWIGTKQGLYLVNPITLSPESLPSNKNDQLPKYSRLSIYDGLIDKETLWLATRNWGLIKIDLNTNTISNEYSKYSGHLNHDSVWTLAKQQDDLWLGYFYDGISRFSPSSETNLSHKYHPQINYTIPYNNVSKLYFDNTGLLWIATTNGLAITDPKNKLVRQIGEYQSITNKHVWSIDKHKSDIWFGTEDGLNKFNLTSNKLTTFPSSNGDGKLPNTIIWSLYATNEHVWLGTNSGLLKFNPKQNSATRITNPKTFEQYGDEESIYNVTEHNNQLILGYYNGSIATFDLKTEQFINTFSDISTGYITNIIPFESTYIVGSQHGLTILNIEQPDSSQRLIDYHITSMKLINEQLWVGTLSDGLYLLEVKDKQWQIKKRLAKTNKLPNNSIKALSVSNNGDVWVSSRGLIYKIKQSDYSVQLYTHQFHWLNMEFHENASSFAKDDLIIFGGNEGIVFFPTDAIKQQTAFPPLTLSSYLISNERYFNITSKGKIKIPPKHKFYAFNVSALEFLSPESIVYQYKLLPGKENWQTLESSELSLSNLPYNEYELKLRATNSNQEFNRQSFDIYLDIMPPFWWSTYAKALYVFLLIGFVLFQIMRLKHMTFKAKHDALTGLPNREYLTQELTLKIKNAERYNYNIAVLFFDLNDFKSINDNYGHDVGDRLLKHVGTHINQCIREHDFFARQSGDEFILILDKIADDVALQTAIERILSAFNQKFTYEQQEIKYQSSIGISIYSAHNRVSVKELIKQADTAMYKSKVSKEPYCYFRHPS
ncbi:MAG: diguanylate cyclase [Gammaproteobacteria bacterium]|nr:diguanylate cyclase [Gammaproteobacteria bacterium]